MNAVLNVEDRLQSFTNWPDTAPVSALELAIAGFVYTGEGDRVSCIFCHGSLYNWILGDEVETEHRRHFPHCPSFSSDEIQYPDVVPIQQIYVNDDTYTAWQPNDGTHQYVPVDQVAEMSPTTERAAESLICRVCLFSERDTVLMPCFHLVLCNTCRSRLENCPVCRQSITGSMKVFLS